MFGMSDIAGILNLLDRFLTFGRSEVTGVQEETVELIHDISRSLVSLDGIVNEVTRLKVEEFSEADFNEIYDYFLKEVAKSGDITEMKTCVKCHTPLGFRSYSMMSPGTTGSSLVWA